MSRGETGGRGADRAEAAESGAEAGGTARTGASGAGSGAAQNGTARNGSTEGGAATSGTTRTGAARAGETPGAAESGTPRPVAPQPGTAQSDTSRSDTPQPGTAHPGASQPGTAAGPARPRARWTLGLFRSELAVTFRRWRTLALLGVLAAVPVLIGIAVKIETDGGGQAGDGGGGGPAFIAQITNNGLFLVFASLAAALPVFLPMTVGVVAGDAVAGEANAGTLRYLLVAPAGRTRLLLAKYAAVVAFCAAATLVVAVSALATGALLFPLGEVTLISGTTVPFSEGLLRALAVAGVVALSLLGVATLGLFISTLTDSGVAAMAATVGLVITVQILDAIPQLDAVHPYLFPHYWLSFADLLRDPVLWEELLRNIGLQGLYAAVFGSAAWARFTARDITA